MKRKNSDGPPLPKAVVYETDVRAVKENMCVECGERPKARHGVIAYGDEDPWPFDDSDRCSVCFLAMEF